MATREQVSERVKEIVVDILKVDPDDLVDDAKLQDDLDADSLDIVELVNTAEECFTVKDGDNIAYKFRIPDEEAKGIQTFGQMVDYILEHAEDPWLDRALELAYAPNE